MDPIRTTRLLLLLLFAACGAPDTAQKKQDDVPPPLRSDRGDRHLVIIGTNDVHGHIERLAQLSGYAECIRTHNPKAEVMLLDGGDLFQGTLESNLNEGKSVIEMFNAIGLTAATVGNHEFDFGPVGDSATARTETDDPRGALKARLQQATFPFLSANLKEQASGQRPDWPNLASLMLVEKGGFRVGLVGLATRDTLRTTISANVTGLVIEDPKVALEREAKALRAQGAELVVGLGHLGGRCTSFDNPEDLSSCELDEELFAVLQALPEGTVDAFVGGHTHRRVAHNVNGVAVIESGARMSHVGRIDVVEQDGNRSVTLSAPQPTCTKGEPCLYQGCDVRAHVQPKVAAIAERYLAQAQRKRDLDLGVTSASEFSQVQDAQSPLGNLLADLILETHPKADLAIMNGGGIRAPLAKGGLRYGDFFEVFPFDNRFATVEMTGAEIEKMFLHELTRGHHSVFSVSGITVRASCGTSGPAIEVRTASGKKLNAKRVYHVVTSDFLATGGDGAFEGAKIKLEEGPLMRDAMVEALKKNHRTIRADDPKLTKQRYPERDALKDCQPRNSP